MDFNTNCNLEGTDRRTGQSERMNQMGREAETESHDLHRIHRASYGHHPIWLFSCRGMRSSPWLMMASWLSGRISRPDFSLARVKLVLQETLGMHVGGIHQSWSFLGAWLWFPSLWGVVWGQEHWGMMAGSLGHHSFLVVEGKA